MIQDIDRSHRQRASVSFRLVSYCVLGIAVLGCTRIGRKERTSESSPEGPNVQLISGANIVLQLPRAVHTLDLVDAPAIVITLTDVYLTSLESKIPGQEKRLAATEEYAREVRLSRILFDQLLAKREESVRLHQHYIPVVLISADARVSVRAVATAFYTSALAGYPNISFVVLGPEGKVKRLSVDAIVPGHMDPSIRRILLAAVQGDSVTLRWREPDGKVQSAEHVKLSALSARTEQIYAAEGKHRDPDDKEWDWGFIWAPDANMNQLALAVDGLSAARRRFNFRGEEHELPGFRLGFKMGKIPTNEEISAIIPIDSAAATSQIDAEMSAFGFTGYD